MCNLKSFEKCINSCNQHPYQDMIHPPNVASCLPVLEFPIVRIIYIQYVPFVSGFFLSTQGFWNSHMLLLYQQFFDFYCWMIFYHVDITHFVYLISYWWTFGSLKFGTVIKKDIWTSGASIFVDAHFQFSWVKT